MISISTDKPLVKAVEQVRRKSVMGTSLTSSQLESLPAEIRDRAMFSAQVEDERILAEMHDRLRSRIELEKSGGRTMDRGVFVEEMRSIVRASGYRRPEGVKKGSLQDLKSSKRLSLVFEMNVAQAEGYARWAADMTPEDLEVEPCYELIRVENRMEIRQWPRIWRAVGGSFYGGVGSNYDYPQTPGRMIALKTDPIWEEISRFGTPWPPFDWGSGMGLRSIGRSESDSLGITSPDDEFTPLEKPFNDGLKMSVRTLPMAARERLRSSFGDAIRFDGHDISWHRNHSPEDNELRKSSIDESLLERARRHYLQTRNELERLRQSERGAELGFRTEEEIRLAEIYLAQASSVAVGRKQLFHETLNQDDAEALFGAVKVLPKQVAAHYESGHFFIWRRDLDGFDPKDLIKTLDNHGGGTLLGYGRETLAFNEPHVLVKIYTAADSKPVVGFHAPVADWRTYAESRAADIKNAWGVDTRVEWEEVRP